jgi:hypothetical protein
MSDEAEEVLTGWLDRRLAGGAESREALIGAHPHLAATLARRLDLLDRVGALEAPPAEAGDGVPRRFDDYRLEELLGRGGMGAVWRAVQVSLSRPVAVKVLHAPLALSADRVRRETAALARLRHPGIVAVHASGVVAGRPYFVMELVEGASLERRLPEGGRLPGREEAARLSATLAQVAHALHHAHEAGVIHRDVKPANVIVDGRGEARLVDFGLARDAAAGTLTMTGEFLGTLAYTAREQALGERVDRRADVYALGATLFHLLAGVPPYPARTLAELVWRMDREAPESLARRNPGLSRDLVTVLQRATAARAEDRYATCLELARDLEAVSDGRPVAARRVGLAGRARRWARRRPAASALAGALVVIGVLGGWLVERTRVERRADRARRVEAAVACLAREVFPEAAARARALAAEAPDDPDVAVLGRTVALLEKGEEKNGTKYLFPAAAAGNRYLVPFFSEPATRLLDRIAAGGRPSLGGLPAPKDEGEARRLALVAATLVPESDEVLELLRARAAAADASDLCAQLLYQGYRERAGREALRRLMLPPGAEPPGGWAAEVRRQIEQGSPLLYALMPRQPEELEALEPFRGDDPFYWRVLARAWVERGDQQRAAERLRRGAARLGPEKAAPLLADLAELEKAR